MCNTVPRRPTTTADPVTCVEPGMSVQGIGQGVEVESDPRPGPGLALVAGHVRIDGAAGRRPRPLSDQLPRPTGRRAPCDTGHG